MKPERRYTQLDGFRIHSLHAGAGEPLVLLHGLSGSHRWWRYTIPALARSYQVHLPELVGFGASRPAPHYPPIPELADLVVRWTCDLGLHEHRLIGHSLGGHIALHVAARHPERIERLVLVAATGIPRPISPAAAVRFAAELLPPRAWGRPSFLPTIALDALRAGPRTLIAVTRHLLADDVRPLLPDVRGPTLVVWGEHDAFAPLDSGRVIAAGIRGAELRVIERAAHNVMCDRPEEFNRIVLEFLRGD